MRTNWFSKNASDLIKIYLWARSQSADDPATFKRLFMKSLAVRYAKNKIVNEAMVERHIGDVEKALSEGN